MLKKGSGTGVDRRHQTLVDYARPDWFVVGFLFLGRNIKVQDRERERERGEVF